MYIPFFCTVVDTVSRNYILALCSFIVVIRLDYSTRNAAPLSKFASPRSRSLGSVSQHWLTKANAPPPAPLSIAFASRREPPRAQTDRLLLRRQPRTLPFQARRKHGPTGRESHLSPGRFFRSSYLESRPDLGTDNVIPLFATRVGVRHIGPSFVPFSKAGRGPSDVSTSQRACISHPPRPRPRNISFFPNTGKI